MEKSLLLSFTILLALSFSVIAILIVFKEKKYGIFHLIPMFIGLSIIDTFFPAGLWIAYGNLDRTPWVYPFLDHELSWGLLYYCLFYLIMFVFLFFTAGTNSKKWLSSFDASNFYIRRRIDLLLIMTGSMFTFGLIYDINAYGGFSDWLFYNFTVRFNPNATDRTPLEAFLKLMPWRALFNTLTFLAFFFRFKFSRQKIYGLIVPFIGAIFAITTSFRGSILIFLLGLFFMEHLRIYIHKKYNYDSPYGIGNETIHKPKYYIFAVLVVMSFVSYGVFRTIYVDTVLNRPKTQESVVYKIVNQGSGIQGVAGVMRKYGKDVDYLMGKTYFDMLLLPIPRSIYTSKPEWYGIDDITVGMGWPATTQTAVTMPGEAYANFGWFGQFVAMVFGIFFGLFLKFANQKGGIFMVLYPSVIIPVIFVSNWMSFTGIMNMFFPTLFITLMLYFIMIKFNKNKSQ